MRYALAYFDEEQNTQAYRIYMTDCLRLALGQGSEVIPRFVDLLKPQQNDQRSGDEIVADVIKHTGIEVIF